MAAFLPDIAPLRASREFRLLWIGQLISQAGSALRLVAVPYQVYVLTGSLVAVAIFGLAIAAFGFLPPTGFVAGLLLLAIAQGADTVSAIFRHTLLQLETPDALRGRLSAINLVFVAGGPQLGQVESGVVADLWSPEASVVTGGLACIGVVFVAHALVPGVARYRADLATADTAA